MFLIKLIYNYKKLTNESESDKEACEKSAINWESRAISHCVTKQIVTIFSKHNEVIKMWSMRDVVTCLKLFVTIQIQQVKD